MRDAPVLIAGGGLVGLSTAMFLGQQGVPSILLERLEAVSPLPRAAFFHMRTLELFRSAGIETQVVEGSERDFVPDGSIVLMDTVSGRKLADIIGDLNAGVADVSPCRRVFLNQPNLEPILLARARDGGADLRRQLEVTGVEQDADGVTVTARRARDEVSTSFRGSYLVAADGAHSVVRDLLSIPFEGREAFSNSVTIYFTADLSRWLADTPVSILYVKNSTLSGFFRMNRAQTSGFLVVNTVGDPTVDPQAAVNAAADVREATLVQLVRAAVGQPDLPVRIDGVSRWRASTKVASAFRAGRVFLAGDAAHIMPPNGGFGGNTGIHDAHNLAWKLAAVLGGWASEALLDSYQAERRPVARFTTEQAFSRYVTRTAPWLAASHEHQAVAPDFDIEFGYRYASGAVVPDGTDGPGSPGTRLPHVWLRHNGARRSSLDLSTRFLLLCGRDGTRFADAVRHVTSPAIDVHRVGNSVTLADAGDVARLGVPDAGAVLVRPDGIVAWRGHEADDGRSVVTGLRQVLALGS